MHQPPSQKDRVGELDQPYFLVLHQTNLAKPYIALLLAFTALSGHNTSLYEGAETSSGETETQLSVHRYHLKYPKYILGLSIAQKHKHFLSIRKVVYNFF